MVDEYDITTQKLASMCWSNELTDDMICDQLVERVATSQVCGSLLMGPGLHRQWLPQLHLKWSKHCRSCSYFSPCCLTKWTLQWYTNKQHLAQAQSETQQWHATGAVPVITWQLILPARHKTNSTGSATEEDISHQSADQAAVQAK